MQKTDLQKKINKVNFSLFTSLIVPWIISGEGKLGKGVEEYNFCIIIFTP